MLGILHRLHKLAIKYDPETQSNFWNLMPRMKPHHSKEGHGISLENNPDNNQILNRITNEMIKKALETAELRAKRSITNLGMAVK